MHVVDLICVKNVVKADVMLHVMSCHERLT